MQCRDLRECATKSEVARLKINVKSLAAEARFNRKEASKLAGMDRWNLNFHRTTKIRREARVALLAYAFLRGRKRSDMDNWTELKWEKQQLLNEIQGKLRRSCGKQVPIEEIERWTAE